LLNSGIFADMAKCLASLDVWIPTTRSRKMTKLQRQPNSCNYYHPLIISIQPNNFLRGHGRSCGGYVRPQLCAVQAANSNL
jgi:hypothetical protein